MLSFLSSARTVLLMGDEALQVYATHGSTARLVESVPWDTPDVPGHVGRLITESCASQPVVVLCDMLEQRYQKENILKVATLDRASMIARKINVTFPGAAARGSMPLTEKPGRPLAGAGGQGGALGQMAYLLAALPPSDMLDATLGAVRASGAQFLGLGMLPAESAGLVARLATRAGNNGSASRSTKPFGWSVLITHHADGGLRQVVTKGADLALTRMTPLARDPEAAPEAWAQDVAREFRATMDYLSRFGYNPSDSLHVVVVAPLAAGALLENAVRADCLFSTLTLPDALRILDWPSRGPGSPSAEVLHVIWAARKRALSMPLSAPEMQAISRPRHAALAAMIILTLAGLGQVGHAAVSYQGLSAARAEVENATTRRDQLQLQYQAELKRQDAQGVDIALIQATTDVYTRIAGRSIDVRALIDVIAQALGRDMRISKLEVTRPDGDDWGLQESQVGDGRYGRPNPPGGAQGQDAPSYIARLTLTFDASVDVDKGNTEVAALRDRLQTLMPETTVSVGKFLKDYSFDKDVVVGNMSDSGQGGSQDFVSIITIEGAPRESDPE